MRSLLYPGDGEENSRSEYTLLGPEDTQIVTSQHEGLNSMYWNRLTLQLILNSVLLILGYTFDTHCSSHTCVACEIELNSALCH